MNHKTDYKKAIQAYQVHLLKLKESDSIDRRLGRIFQKQKQPDLAIKAYQRAIDLKVQPAWVYQSLGLLWQEQQQTELAIEAYQKAIDLKVQPAWIYSNIGCLWGKIGQVKLAIEAYHQAITLDSQQPGWVYENLGAIFSQQNCLQEAILVYQRAIEVHPILASTLDLKIANIFNKQGKSNEAKNAYKQASLERSKDNINQVINFLQQYFPSQTDKLDIDILDNGCEPSGIQLSILAEYTNGKVVGRNIHSGFPEATVKHRRNNTEFYWIDGQQLTFEDNLFDAVISLNVLEHVPNPKQYLQECYRVMRPRGFGYFSWYPIWSGATGHHIHPDMINNAAHRLRVKCPENYDLDGRIIPFWGHLWLSAGEMLSLLTETHQYHPLLAQWIVDYIYKHPDINRWFWQDILAAFESISWKAIEVKLTKKNIPSNIFSKLELKYQSVESFQICGATIIVQKK